MKNISALLALAIVANASLGHAQTTVIDVPGVHLDSGKGGTTIVVPGVQMHVPNTETGQVNSSVIMTTNDTKSASSDFVNANLSGMDFSSQKLSGADFTNAVLVGANFQGADLSGADFTNADLSGANLTNANFSGADLTNANLKQAIAVNTRFDGATLTNVDMGVMIKTESARPSFTSATEIKRSLKIDPSRPNEKRKIDLTVNFDFNSDKLTKDGALQVKEIAAALADESLGQSHIIVEGHTDNVGSDAYNEKLSDRRAKRVMKTLLEEYRLSPERISARGMGETQPIASNESDIGRAQNRRVTLVNLGKRD
jgi:outer membrane protein OmpA-like peptidoglycan-associated protein